MMFYSYTFERYRAHFNEQKNMNVPFFKANMSFIKFPPPEKNNTKKSTTMPSVFVKERLQNK